MTIAPHRPLAGWNGLGALRLPLVAAAVWCLTTVLVAGVPPFSRPLQAGAVAGRTVAPDEASALAAARAQGSPVQALSDRTELSQTFANPSGTLTLNEGVVPVRVHRPDGTWAPVDRTLQAQPDGTVGPRASVVAVSFSGGGTGPLAEIARDGRELALSWPGALPAPALNGPTATYAGVLPGVDLQVTAQPLGFSDLLVVRTPLAAANPALATVRFALSARGLSVRATGAGALTAADALGQEVFGAPAPSMWDATGATTAVGVGVAAGELDLLPDRRLLTGAGTRFPVSIDPYVAWTGVEQAWTKTDACFPNQTYWNGANDSDPNHFGAAKVGRAPEGYGDPCNGTTWRSMFQLDTSRVADKTIHSAKFNVFETYAPACNAEPLDLWRTSLINSSTDWNHQGWINQLASWSGAHGYPPGPCSARSFVTFDVTGIVAQVAAGDGTNLTLGLRAPNENLCHSDSTGNTCQWKRFDSGAISDGDTPFLSIEYNTPPNTPAGLFTDGSPFLYANGRIPCGSGANYVNTTTPTLNASISDGDDTGSSQPQPLSATYAWSTGSASGTVRDPSSGGRTPGSGNTSVATRVTVPGGRLASGDSVSWSVDANDGIVDGPTSATCHLSIDTTPETVAPGVTSTDGRYPPGGAGTTVGTPGQLTFDPGGTTDVAGYLYGLNTSTPWRFVPAGGTGSTAAVTIDPPVVGDNSLVVRLIGLGGNLGPVQTYDVITTHPTTGAPLLLARWAMDEGAGTSVLDGTGGHDGTAAGSFGWTAGHTGASGDHAVDLTSSPGGFVSTAEPAVDTRYGYTVSAWVKLDDTSAFYHVVGQDGVTGSGYYLESFGGTAPRWGFSVPTSDGTNPTILHAFSDAAPRVGVWTHLVGVYCADPSCLAPGDTAPGRLYLYVDDGGGLLLQASQPAFSSPWMSTGGTQIGRGRFNGAFTENLNGAVDDVSVYWADPCPQPAAAPAVSTCGVP